MDLDQFILFNPVTGSPKEVPDGAGNYIVVLRVGHSLPDAGLPVETAKFRGMDIIYTGVAGESSGLRRRITWAHFGNNAGRSTLRLSLGVLMGFKPIPRDASNPNNGHSRFRADEEERLTDWMKDSLLVYFFPNEDYEMLEEELIVSLNPPLNLMKNYNLVNSELRSHIYFLRSQVQYGDIQRPSGQKEKLLDFLSAPETFLEDPDCKFRELAENLLNNYQIQKGGHRYWMTDIEFYLYADGHQDIITYPRNCGAGKWFFHASGVDITFKSKVEISQHPRNHKEMPYLTKDAVFGGILLRGIAPVDNHARKVDGPMNVCDELFDQFDAFQMPTDFPKIVAAPSPRGVSVASSARYGLNPVAGKKVHDILSYNYSGFELSERELIDAYGKYLEKSYRFQAES